MRTKVETLRKVGIGLAIVAISILLFLFVFWPGISFSRDAAWVGQISWIAFLGGTIFVGVQAADDLAKDNESRNTNSVLWASNKHAGASFRRKTADCLNDRSISGYFSRNHVEKDDVVNVLAEGEAFSQACDLKEYEPYLNSLAEYKEVSDRVSAVIEKGIINPKTVTCLILSLVLVCLWFAQISGASFASSGLTFLLVILSSTSALSYSSTKNAHDNHGHYQPKKKLALAGICACVSVCALVLPPVLVGPRWLPSVGTFFIMGFSILVFFILASGETLTQCRALLGVTAERVHLLFLREDISTTERSWLENCDPIIKEQANLRINVILGKDKDRLLVEQDSEGLRRLQDQSYTVSTRSERRIASVLSQMDAGSIALAGPRGAGKSTLLRKFSGQAYSGQKTNEIHLYIPAPAEYIPRDFIAAFLQQLCETYLNYVGWALPGPIYRESQDFRSRLTVKGFFRFARLIVRTFIVSAILFWVIRSLVGTHYHHMYDSVLADIKDRGSQVYSFYRNDIYKIARPYWPFIRIIILVIASLFFLFLIPRWLRYLRPRREPELVAKARDYLRRLQVEKTITWGTGRNIGFPNGGGVSLSSSRGGSASYVPWTLPELVTHTRRFMYSISEQFPGLNHVLVVGIDEIDRIGSLEHAEKFIGEIKAVFGVEKCFFLVAVAEDVGSIFSQRVTAGRSILENAFDDIVVVEPLDLAEARDLLQKRVPGFTESFVYLVLALSGGLPRELIRITRRLVDVNQETVTGGRPLRLQDLAFCLVKEELIEAIRATRNQLARLALHSNWTAFFEKVQSVSLNLRYAPPYLARQSYELIKELSELPAPDTPEGVPTMRDLVLRDEEEAKRIVRDFTAFSYFGLTIVDAFSDRYFDMDEVSVYAARKLEGSYEELAIARAELTVSPENSRAMLQRFRNRLSSRWDERL